MGDKRGIGLDVIEAVEDVTGAVTFQRRGCFVHNFHRQEGVVMKRQPYDDEQWGVLDPNSFGTQNILERGGRYGFWDCLNVAKGYLRQ